MGISILADLVNLQQYTSYYEAEIELNNKFNLFARNYALAFGGENSVRAQIGFKSSQRKSLLTCGAMSPINGALVERTILPFDCLLLPGSIHGSGRGRRPADGTRVPDARQLFHRPQRHRLAPPLQTRRATLEAARVRHNRLL